MSDAYDDATYGDRIADVYDERYDEVLAADTQATVAFLAPLAGEGPALELGIGTGRVALPLAASGVPVHGIDASAGMVDKLHAKPGGDAITVTMSSFADFDLGERFPLIYVVFNTFFGLLTQDEQVSCMQAVARHLTPGGAFVMQAFVPDVSRFQPLGQRVSAIGVGSDRVELDVSMMDLHAQRTDTQHIVIREGHTELYPVRIRFAYPSELDLMARLAGMRLRERWASWDRAPFPGTNWQHISVWEPVG